MTDYELGEKRVDWVFAHMPVMQRIRATFEREGSPPPTGSIGRSATGTLSHVELSALPIYQGEHPQAGEGPVETGMPSTR